MKDRSAFDRSQLENSFTTILKQHSILHNVIPFIITSNIAIVGASVQYANWYLLMLGGVFPLIIYFYVYRVRRMSLSAFLTSVSVEKKYGGLKKNRLASTYLAFVYDASYYKKLVEISGMKDVEEKIKYMRYILFTKNFGSKAKFMIVLPFLGFIQFLISVIKILKEYQLPNGDQNLSFMPVDSFAMWLNYIFSASCLFMASLLVSKSMLDRKSLLLLVAYFILALLFVFRQFHVVAFDSGMILFIAIGKVTFFFSCILLFETYLIKMCQLNNVSFNNKIIKIIKVYSVVKLFLIIASTKYIGFNNLELVYFLSSIPIFACYALSLGQDQAGKVYLRYAITGFLLLCLSFLADKISVGKYEYAFSGILTNALLFFGIMFIFVSFNKNINNFLSKIYMD